MVRPYEQEDLRGCAAVFCSAFAAEPWHEHWTQALAETRIRELMCSPLSLGYVYEKDGKICGFAVGRTVTYLHGREYVIDEFCILPDMQRSGHGSALLRRIADDMRKMGFVNLVLQTSKGFPSERFYRKNGFVQNPDMITMYHVLNPAQ